MDGGGAISVGEVLVVVVVIVDWWWLSGGGGGGDSLFNGGIYNYFRSNR